MPLLSVSLGAPLIEFIEEMVKDGKAKNKADVVRKALNRMREEEAVQAILKARKGPILRGDLRELVKKFRD